MKKQATPIKVLVFSLSCFPFIGGAEVALQEIMRRLPGIRFEVIAARFDKRLPPRESFGNITVYRVGPGNKLDKYFYPFRAFLLAKKLHQENNYHLIWAMLATWAGIPALWFKLKFPRVKYLLTLQSGDTDWFIWLRTWFWYPLYKMIYTRPDHIQVISRWLAARARRYGYQGEISLLPNGVDLDKFKPVENLTQKKALRRELNLPLEDKIIFTSSRLAKKNNLAVLIQAVKLLSEQNLPVRLVVAGAGPLEKRLKNLVNKINLGHQVVFLNHLSHDKLTAYYQAADIFVRPSLSEGQGISFLEAMACGLPVIASPVGGIVDFLTDRKTGLFCQPDDPRALADKIKLLFSDNSLTQNIKDSALELVKQNYSWEDIAAEMRGIIMKLVR